MLEKIKNRNSESTQSQGEYFFIDFCPQHRKLFWKVSYGFR